MQSKLITILALAGSTFALAVRDTDPAYPGVIEVKKWYHELPKELVPGGAQARAVKRADEYNAGVYLCNDAPFDAANNYCVHFVAPKGNCINLGDDLNDNVSAVGPDETYTCSFYSAFDCSDSEGYFDTGYPGISNLQDFQDGQFNDKISSYRCA